MTAEYLRSRSRGAATGAQVAREFVLDYPIMLGELQRFEAPARGGELRSGSVSEAVRENFLAVSNSVAQIDRALRHYNLLPALSEVRPSHVKMLLD